jgi:hypothetical protein
MLISMMTIYTNNITDTNTYHSADALLDAGGGNEKLPEISSILFGAFNANAAQLTTHITHAHTHPRTHTTCIMDVAILFIIALLLRATNESLRVFISSSYFTLIYVYALYYEYTNRGFFMHPCYIMHAFYFVFAADTDE